MATKELPVLTFSSASAWKKWISKHYAKPDGLWIKVARKASGIESVTHDEALDIALCYGWIDGQRKGLDSEFFLQKFTPRRRNSLWSKRNIDKIDFLTTAGKMKPSGLVEVEAAKREGRWEAAYDSPKNMVVPEDFLKALKKNKKARLFFSTLNKTNLYAIAWRLATARKPEIRKKRFDNLLAMLEREEKFH